MLAYTREVTYLEEGDVAVITCSDAQLTDVEGRVVSRKPTTITWDASAAEKSGYPHFMLKEIHEQPQTILDTMRGRYSHETGEADLPDIGLTAQEFAAADRIWIVACGTSWHAGLVGKYLFEEMVRAPVQVDIGS
jgi:glucosamine--fructose-6-phosphate aminotransferase (isomerizing)